MTRRFPLLVAVTLLLACDVRTCHVGLQAAEPTAMPLASASIRLEQNATDGDAEVVIEATGGDDGLAALRIVAPDGRTVVDFQAADSKLGLRQFNFESPEPANDGSVQADFPEGQYTFHGKSVNGATLRGAATLSHKLPPTATLIQPGWDQEGVPTENLQIQWSLVKETVAYVVTLEQEETGMELIANLPSIVTSLAVPAGLLTPDTEYKVAIGTISSAGNRSFVETSFTTAASD